MVGQILFSPYQIKKELLSDRGQTNFECFQPAVSLWHWCRLNLSNTSAWWTWANWNMGMVRSKMGRNFINFLFQQTSRSSSFSLPNMLQKLSPVGNICQDNLKIWPHVAPQDYAWNQSLHGSVRWENFNSVIVISLRPLDLKLSITHVRFPNHPPWFESLPKILDCYDILFFSCALTVTKRLRHFPYATVSVSILDK